jgi:ribosomal protein L7/L12
MANLSDEQIGAIQTELAAGRPINAIRLYRQYTGVGLAEAKQAVDQLSAGQTPQIADPSSDLSEDQLQSILAELRANQKIQAIKLHRQYTNSDLAAAKIAVEQLAASHGILSSKAGCGTAVVLFMAVSAAAYFLILY